MHLKRWAVVLVSMSLLWGNTSLGQAQQGLPVKSTRTLVKSDQGGTSVKSFEWFINEGEPLSRIQILSSSASRNQSYVLKFQDGLKEESAIQVLEFRNEVLSAKDIELTSSSESWVLTLKGQNGSGARSKHFVLPRAPGLRKWHFAPEVARSQASSPSQTSYEVEGRSVTKAEFDQFLSGLVADESTRIQGEVPQGLYTSYRAKSNQGRHFQVVIKGNKHSLNALPE